jgi:DNA-binding LacI/PurR family transcriptional regulator
MRAVEIGDADGPLPYVAIDGADGIRQCLAHLQQRGYRSPCFLSFPSEYEPSVSQRREAFLAESAARFGNPGPVFNSLLGDDALGLILREAPSVDSVVCVSDEHAYALLAAARRRGIKIPGELAVTGFDCLPTLGPVPVVTSVQTPIRELARAGVEKLCRLIEGLPTERETVLPVSLRTGDTT